MTKLSFSAKAATKTELPNEFIDKYMPESNPTYTLVYIFGLRYSQNPIGIPLSSELIASTLNILETDVLRAWEYWENKGLVKLHKENGKHKIEYVDDRPNKPIRNKKLADIKVIKADSGSDPSLDNNNNKFIPEIVKKPVYTTKELELYKKNDENVEKLYNVCEDALGRAVSPTEMGIAFSFYEFYKLPFEVIYELFAYVKKEAINRFEYIEKIAVSWSQAGISTASEAKDYIEKYHSIYYKVLKEMGITGRNPIAAEKTIIDKWVNEYNFSFEMIKEACQTTILTLSKPNIKYTDSILTNWHNDNITTKPQIENAKKPAPKPKKTKSKFNNFSEREIDFDEIERMERELRKTRRNS